MEFFLQKNDNLSCSLLEIHHILLIGGSKMGKEIVEKIETAEEEFASNLELAKKGDAEAALLVGYAYFTGIGVEKMRKKL